VNNLKDTSGQRRKISDCYVYSGYTNGSSSFGDNKDTVICAVSPNFVLGTWNETAYNGAKVTAAPYDFSSSFANITSGTICKLIGWGSVSMVNLGNAVYANELQVVSLPILDFDKCVKMWPK
jgi:hypothetical protein